MITEEILEKMIESNGKLYEKILATKEFCIYFNKLIEKALDFDELIEKERK